MGKDSISDLLKYIFSQYNNIDYSPKIIEEIRDRLNNTGIAQKFMLDLQTRLELLQNQDLEFCLRTEFFEVTQGSKGLYSMKFKRKFINYRIIFYCNNDKQILLHGFEEKKGKKVSEYTNHLKIANDRRKGMNSNE